MRQHPPATQEADPASLALAERYAARRWLWDHAGRDVARIRACGLRAQGRRGGEGSITLRLGDSVGGSPRASWAGLQSCGSTWACPVCAEKIQAHRNAEVATALDTAKRRGLVVGFLTFTVRHKRRHSLADVWAAVSRAWRGTTSGSPREWDADRDAFGIVGYLRLTEVTHGGANGWHVHIHALVFLRPHGRPVWGLTKREGPAAYVGPTAVPAVRLGPLTAEQTRRGDLMLAVETGTVERFIGPLTKEETARRYEGPGSLREVTHYVPSSRAVDHLFADFDRGRSLFDVSYSLYERDVLALGDRMFARWRKALAGTSYEPDDDHGSDARLVTDPRELAAYFAKHTYSVKGTDAAAAEVTGSYRKKAKRGNVTPFGILARIVNAPEVVDPATGELVASPDPVDLALWREWESASKGKRQLLWSNGLRAYLGLADEATDAEVAEVEEPGRNVAVFDPRAYRRMAFLGLLPRVMLAAMADDDGWSLYALLDRYKIPWTPPQQVQSLVA